jgi:hypothetical protein
VEKLPIIIVIIVITMLFNTLHTEKLIEKQFKFKLNMIQLIELHLLFSWTVPIQKKSEQKCESIPVIFQF